MQLKSWCSPGQLVAVMLAGWINRHQQAVIAYQKEEIKVLREMLGGKRLRFTDEQRRRLALKAQALSRCTLKERGPLVTRCVRKLDRHTSWAILRAFAAGE